ncbi:hypothetical protein A9K71_21285 [Mesorhizobium sp. WSM3873]|nr:hypothetical protein A9K71_21285 [Mesorhizobium sp. WSM3873]
MNQEAEKRENCPRICSEFGHAGTDLGLPDDVDALKAMFIAMAEKAALLEERKVHLELVNKSAEERIAD